MIDALIKRVSVTYNKCYETYGHRFYPSLVRSIAQGKSQVKLFPCKQISNRW